MTDHLHALPIGHQLGEYRIERVLGSGGFGITYYAWERHLDKPVAIKEYLPNEFALRTDTTTVRPKSTSDAADYQWGLERFLDEARTLARFDHPHLNKVYRFFEDNGTAYMVLEYIEGETLSELLRRESGLEQARLRRLLEELLSGLEEVHGAGFVHRDVKPGNIMLRTDGTAVLLDFGAARQAVGQRSKSITSILTPGYAPIEQYAQKMDSVGPWSDLYALGMVAYRCISGLGDGELPDAVSRALMSKDGEDKDLTPAAIAGKGRYDQPLLEAIDWAIKITEGERPQDVAALRRALSGSRKPASVSKAAAGRPDSEMNRPGRKWTLPLLPLCLAASLAAIAAGGWWVLLGDEWSYWRGVACTEEAAVQAYRERYPAGRYEGKARACLAAIERKQKQEAADRLATEVEQTRLAEENRKAEAAAKRQREEAARLAAAEEKKKREAELKRLANEKHQAEAELKKLAEEKRKAEAAAKRQREEAARLAAAEEKKKREAELKRLAEEKHQAEAELKRLADEKRKVEAEVKRQQEEAARLAAAEEERKEAARLAEGLHTAARRNDRATAALLLERGAAVNAKDEYGDTPLHYAASKNAVATAALLVERGAAVNAKTNNGSTPLHLAAWNNAVATATLLVERGAAVNARSNHGWTPLYTALISGADGVAALLRRHGGREEERKEAARLAEGLHTAARRNDRATVALLLERGAAVNAKDEYGDTPLHYAASKNAVATATLLVERGAVVNAKGRFGSTPLHYAASKNAVATATLLVERGAAVNARSNHGRTPLYTALISDADGVAALLRRHGGRR